MPPLPLHERFTPEELAAARAIPPEELRARWHLLSDRVQAITRERPSDWWRDEGVAASVFKALRVCELYRTLAGKVTAGKAKTRSEANVLRTRDVNENGYMQDCVWAYCLSEEANNADEPNEGVRVWGHTDKSVQRALWTLSAECPCGAAEHVRK